MTITEASPIVSERHRLIADTAIAVLAQVDVDITISLMREVAEAVGISLSAMRQAQQRWRNDEWTVPGGQGYAPDEFVPEPKAEPDPEPPRAPTPPPPLVAAERQVAEAMQRVDQASPDRGGPRSRPSAVTPRRPGEPAVKTCISCNADKAIEEFIVKAQYKKGRKIRSSTRSTYCHTCRRAKSRRRYLTTQQINAVAGILQMELLKGDSIVGDACHRCGGELQVGEIVDVQTAAVCHHECPTLGDPT